MRLNQPVTHIERHLKEGEYIVSKTDAKGRITYVNRPFVEMSGFTEEELIGAPHNIVRHPDMPPAAFADLWRTLRSGKSWRGMVKNRCKNGDYYWVEANANPIWENGRVVGYMSLRTMPTRAQVADAERVYRLFREGKANGSTVKEGRVIKSGLSSILEELSSQSISTLVSAACAFILVAFVGLFGVSVMAGKGGNLSAGATYLPGAITLVALILTGWMWWFLRSRVFMPLNEVVRTCQIIAAGNLASTIPTDSRTEIGQLRHAISIMAGNITSIVADVSYATGNLAASSGKVSATAQSISQSAGEQAVRVEQASSLLMQMSDSINQNTENAKITDSMAAKAAKEATEGGKSVNATVSAMKSIVDKIGVIDDIANQTNLLALNAAIEAARAGVYGKGFAIVATEVRKLAERSQAASQDIHKLASGSFTMAENTGKLLGEMVPSINKTSGLVQEITSASEKQSSGVGQVNTSMNQMSQVTKQNAAASEELAVTAEDLSCQTGQMQKLMGFFNVGRRC